MTDPDDYRDLTVTATMTETTARYKFGDRVEMIAASHDNPEKFGFFIRQGRSTARMNGGPYVEMTDGKGKVWRCPPDNVRPAPTTPPAPTAAPSPAPQVGLTKLQRACADPSGWCGNCGCGHDRAGLAHLPTCVHATPAAGEALEETAKRIMWAIERNGPYNAGTADGRWHSMPKESRDRCLRAALAAARKEANHG